MKKFFTFQGVINSFLTLLFILSTLSSFAEGTKQIRPASGDAGYLVLDNNWSQFALVGCPTTSRLHIKICNVGEKIYYGFRQTSNDVQYTLRRPDGTAAVGPTALPSSGAGRIGSGATGHATAVAGPSAIVGGSGYNALVHTSTMAGDYYIEFSNQGSRRTFDLFDITVATSGDVAIPGRVWSQAWMFSTNSYTNRFKGKLFIYADDMIVTSLDFNGMQPYVFVVSANSTGTQSTGDAAADRQSRSGLSTYPQYKIFLNDPDVNCYPTGTFGSLTGAVTITGCGSERCINIPVDSPGNILVLLDLNGTAGYQPGTTDRQFSATVVAGNNCIVWDTKDGLGNTLAGGTNINMQIDYLNGITHLPLYDVEYHSNGYIVTLVRPASAIVPKLFWDDTNIPSGTTEFTGCTSPCHTWGWNATQSDNAATDYGNRNTINTWWYGNIINTSVPYSVQTIVVDANKNNAAGVANDTTVCTSATTIPLAGLVSGSTTTGIWSTTSGGNFSNATSLSSTYTPSAGEKVDGGISKLVLTSTGSGTCPDVSDTLTIHYVAGPTVDAGPAAMSACKNNPSVVLQGGSLTVATEATWSSPGAGTFVPNNTTLTATYTPSAAEVTTGSVTLTLTTTAGNGLCPAATDQTTITLENSPTSVAGGDQIKCANNAVTTLAGTVTNATSQQWTTAGTGIFSDASSLTSTYTPSAADISAGSVTLTLTASKAGCTDVTSAMTITFTDAPTADAGVDQSVCKNNAVTTLTGAVTGATGGTWSGGSGGTFADANALSTTYTPSTADKNAGSVTLTLTTTGMTNNCLAVNNPMTITFTAAPTVAVSNGSMCSNAANTSLTVSSITGASEGIWTGAGTFTPSATTLNATYIPTAAERALLTAAVIFTTTDNGNCNSTGDTAVIVMFPAPTVSANVDQEKCANNPVVTLAGSVGNGGSPSWTGGTVASFSSTTNVAATYTPTAAEIASGSVTLTLTASKAQCVTVSDPMTITFTDAPTVSAGADQIVCANNPSVVLNGSVTVATGGIWSGGAGTFVPDNTSLNATYTPTATEISNGSVTLTLTSTGMEPCTAVAEDMIISFTAAPTVSAGVPQSVCFNNSSVTLAGTKTIATGGTWTGGTGTFNPNRTTLNAVYTPSAAEKTAGSVGLTLTTTGSGNCNEVSGNTTITITAAPTVDAGDNKTVCEDNPVTALTGTVTVATGGIWSGGAGTFSPSNTSLVTSYTPTVPEILAGSVKLYLTSTGNNDCNAVKDSMTITITKAPTVDAGPNQTLCGTTNTVDLDGAVTIATGGTWTTAGTGTFTPNTLTGKYKPSDADKTAGFVDLTLTSTGNGTCNAVSGQVRLSFTAAPFITAGADQTVCTNEYPVQLNATGSAGSWGGSSGTISDDEDLNATYIPSAAQELAGFVVLTITTHPVFGCGPVSDQVRITILPKPVPGAGGDQTVCGTATSIPLTGTISGSATGGFWTTDGQGSFSPNAATLTASYVPTAAERASGATITNILTSTPNAPCPAVEDEMTITIDPEVTVFAGPDQTFCADVNSYNLSGTIGVAPSATWSVFSGTGTIGNVNDLNTTYTPSPADKLAGTVTLRLTTAATANCAAIFDDIIFTITPAPTADAGTPQTICSDSLSITLAGVVGLPATGGQWTTNGTGIFSPDAATLNTLYIPSAADRLLASLTFTLTTTAGIGTCGAVSSDVIVTIDPKPVVSAGDDLSVCSDVVTVNVTGTVSNAGGLTWTRSGTGTFADANILSPVYTPSAADKTGGTVTLTATSTGNGSCKAVQDQMFLTFTPIPTVDAGADRTVCADVAGITLNGTSTIAPVVTWTTTIGSGTFDDPNSLTATYDPSDADTAAGSVTLKLTTSGGTCNSLESEMIITITKKPIVIAGDDVTICADSTFVELDGAVFNAGGGTWSSSGTGNFFPNNFTLNASYVPSVADKTSSPITLTLTSDANGSCNAVSDTKIITITPGPTATAGDDQTICADATSINLSGTFSIAGGGIWTTSGNGTFNDATLPNAVYTPSVNDKNAGTVTLTFTTTTNGSCKSAADQMILTITPIPIVNPGADQTVCADLAAVPLTGTVTNAGGSTWTTNGTGGFTDANSVTTSYFPTDADKLAGTITLTLTSTGNLTCNAVAESLTLIITEAPTADAGDDDTICADATGVTLNGQVTVTTTGTWSSNGTGIFSPSNTALNAEYIPSATDKSNGSVILTLTTTGNGTCNAVADNMTLIITPAPTADAGDDVTICADFEFVPLAGTITGATGGIWSTDGSGSFSPNATDLNAFYSPSPGDKADGTVTLTLTTTGMGTCNAVSNNMIVTITPMPTINAGPDVSACIGGDPIVLNPTVTVATGGFWTSSGTGTFAPDDETLSATYDPSPADEVLPSVLLIVSTTGNGACDVQTDSLIISFSAAPAIEAGPSKSVCETDLPVQLEGSGSGTWSGGLGTFSPNANTLNATYTPDPTEIGTPVILTLTRLAAGGCPVGNDQVTITINAGGPTIDAGVPLNACANTTGVVLGGSFTGAAGVKWSTGSGTGTFLPSDTDPNATFIPSASQITAGVANLTLTTTGVLGGCTTKSDMTVVNIGPTPTIFAGSNQNICASEPTVNLTTTKTVATGVSWAVVAPAAGSFDDNTSLTPVYTVNPTDITAGSITLRATTTGNGTNCEAVSDDIIISFTDVPTTVAGGPSSHCADVNSVALNGIVNDATGGIWTTDGTGTFSPNSSTLNASYVPSADDKTGAVTLTLTSVGSGVCASGASTRVLTFTPPPTVDAGLSQSFCSDQVTTTLTGSFADGAGGVLWTTSGTGVFDDATLPGAVYTPSTLDKSNGGVNLTITTTGSAPCAEIQDFATLTILPAPSSVVNAGFDQSLCKDVASVQLQGIITIASAGKWSIVPGFGTGTFFPNDSTLDAEYIPSSADTAAGIAVLRLTTTVGNGICNPAFDDITITFTPTPTVIVPVLTNVCGDGTSKALSGAITVASGGMWTTGGSGTFAPNEFTTNATYIPSAADISNGSVGLTLTSTGNGTCNAVSASRTLTFKTKPTVNAGSDKLVCSDATSISVTGTTTQATGRTWSSSGTGSFASAGSLSTTYNPTAADIASTRINLFLTTTGTAPCSAVTDTITIDFTPAPTADAGPAQTICADLTSLTLNGTVTVATGGLWTTNGSGTFVPNSNSLTASYNPSEADKTSGTVTLTLTTTGNGTCNAVNITKDITIVPKPIVSPGPAVSCAFLDGAILDGDVLNAGGGLWSSTGTGTFSASAAVIDGTYFPSVADLTAGSVTLTLVSTGNGTCNPVSASSTLIVTPLPIADAGSDQFVCTASSITLVAEPSADVTYEWTDNVGTSIGTDESVTVNVPANTFVVLSVTDVQGCVTRDTVQLDTYDLPTLTLPAHACLSDTLVLDADPTNMPVVPGEFQWYRNNTIMSGENDFTLVVKQTGDYTILWSYNACETPASTNVTAPPVLQTVDTIVACENGQATLTTVSTPATGLSYAWTNGGVTQTATLDPVLLGINTYYITATDVLTCSALDSIKVLGIPVPQFNIEDDTACQNEVMVLNGVPTDPAIVALNPSFQWKKDGVVLSDTTSTLNVVTSTPGTFQHIVLATIDQCVGSDTADIVINPIPADVLPADTRFCIETDQRIVLDAGAGANLVYQWTNQNAPISVTTQTDTVTIDGMVYITITNSLTGCLLNDSILVKDVCKPKVFMPTAFTPNGNGTNEFYTIFHNYTTNFKMTIFNRWGEIIYYTENPDEPWDGMYRGEPMPLGVYPWIITYEGDAPEFKGPYKLEGSVTLIR